MNGRKAENRSNYLKLLDLLNEYPEFFNENEEGCPEHIVYEIKELGQLMFDGHAEKLVDLDIDEYYRMSTEGKTDSWIAGTKGVSRSTLTKWKRENGVYSKNRRNISIETVIQLFDEGKSQTEIARQLNSSQPYISRLLKKEGVTA